MPLLTLLLMNIYSSSLQQRVSYAEFLSLIDQDKISEVTISAEQISATLKDRTQGIITFSVADDDLIPLLKEKKIRFSGVPQNTFWNTFFVWIFPLLLMFLFFRYMMNAQGGRLLSLNKSKAKIYAEKDIKTSFSDVAGCDEAKDELIEIVNFLKDPDKYSRLGGHVPKGVLLVGPPGTGKTLMARAVAGEANVPFFSINGSEFVELFVGMGAARVRDLFNQARSQSPCIIFIDELDALGKSRAFGHLSSGGHDEKEQTLNQLLAELDGFDSKSGVILLAATNRPEILDPALLRSGRFDRQILLDKPDQRGRLQILNIHAKNVKLKKDINLSDIASMTPGFTGADLANLVNEAALIATRRKAEDVDLNDFTLAIERIVAGLERKQRLMNPEEKRRVAFHEMGHATVALALQCQDLIQKVSIIPRGIGALGYTLQRPVEDRYLMTRSELNNKIAMLLSGRVSEQLFCGDLSTGAGDDLVKATNIARAMVTQYGMSESLGLVSEENISPRFLQIPDYYGGQTKNWSDKTGEKIDLEVKSILETGRLTSERVLNENKEFIEISVRDLLQKETLNADEIENLWNKYGKIYESKMKNLFRSKRDNDQVYSLELS
ncbi:MAG: ATP-dependent zinc metalloprotease FtsH [Oligoflexia bacterium]|nr:MAG: ATP-dependent zinc metalloprotease FtsH [Oligoflexia bacterium]